MVSSSLSSLTVNFVLPPTVSCLAEQNILESGVQFYSNSLSTEYGSKKKIHGGDGSKELKEGGGYQKGAAAFLEFHEVRHDSGSIVLFCMLTRSC